MDIIALHSTKAGSSIAACFNYVAKESCGKQGELLDSNGLLTSASVGVSIPLTRFCTIILCKQKTITAVSS